MSKSRVIPSNTKPNWTCEIGNKVYTYMSGTTQTVPDEVAVIIDNYYAMQAKEDDPTIRVVTEIGANPTDKEVPTAKATAEAIASAVPSGWQPGQPAYILYDSNEPGEDSIIIRGCTRDDLFAYLEEMLTHGIENTPFHPLLGMQDNGDNFGFDELMGVYSSMDNVGFRLDIGDYLIYHEGRLEVKEEEEDEGDGEDGE